MHAITDHCDHPTFGWCFMLYANDIDFGRKIEPLPGWAAVCPDCNGDVLAKCGEKNIWHWAHRSLACETGKEPETEWHLNWKRQFPKESCEVKIGDFRADVFHKGMVIEFQNSTISPEKIRAREQNYTNMVWVINGADFYNRFEERDRGSYYTYRWKHWRKYIEDMTKPVYFDFTQNSRIFNSAINGYVYLGYLFEL